MPCIRFFDHARPAEKACPSNHEERDPDPDFDDKETDHFYLDAGSGSGMTCRGGTGKAACGLPVVVFR